MVTGNYRVRLLYVPAAAEHAHQGHAGHAAPARLVKLAPRFGERGFHYGAGTSLSGRTDRICVAFGPAVMQVQPPLTGRFAKRAIAVFDLPAGRR